MCLENVRERERETHIQSLLWVLLRRPLLSFSFFFVCVTRRIKMSGGGGSGGGGGGAGGSPPPEASSDENKNIVTDKGTFVSRSYVHHLQLLAHTHSLTHTHTRAGAHCATFRQTLGPVIGKGGFGTVYQGLHVEGGTFVAIKQLKLSAVPKVCRECCCCCCFSKKWPREGKKTYEQLQDQLSGIMAEIELLRSLDHPNIVRYITYLATESSLSIVMECVAHLVPPTHSTHHHPPPLLVLHSFCC